MMTRRGNPRMQRRYSLPATPTLVEATRHVPEGSDTFKKALQELSVSEPHHAPAKTETKGLFGLNNIQEGDESEYTDSDDVTSSPGMTSQTSYVVEYPVKVQRSRRYSSPSCLTSSDDRVDGKLCEIDKEDSKPDNKSSILQTLNQQRKEYFIKHGRFPIGGSAKSPRRPTSTHERTRKSDIAFGTALNTKLSKIHI